MSASKRTHPNVGMGTIITVGTGRTHMVDMEDMDSNRLRHQLHLLQRRRVYLGPPVLQTTAHSMRNTTEAKIRMQRMADIKTIWRITLIISNKRSNRLHLELHHQGRPVKNRHHHLLLVGAHRPMEDITQYVYTLNGVCYNLRRR